MLKKFKIFDNQLWTYRWDWQWFTVSEAIDSLADYHSIDFSWVDNEDTELTIYEFLDTLKNENERLSFLCEHWDWDTHHCIFWIDWEMFGWDYYRDDTLSNFIAWYTGKWQIEMEVRFYYLDK